jgi:hypothetical protein
LKSTVPNERALWYTGNMKDFIGRELTVGDLITYDRGNGGGQRQSELYQVTGVSDQDILVRSLVHEYTREHKLEEPRAAVLITSEYQGLPYEYVRAMLLPIWVEHGASNYSRYQYEKFPEKFR